MLDHHARWGVRDAPVGCLETVKSLREEDVREELSQDGVLVRIDLEGVTEDSVFHDVESLLGKAQVRMRTRVKQESILEQTDSLKPDFLSLVHVDHGVPLDRQDEQVYGGQSVDYYVLNVLALFLHKGWQP